MLNVLADEHRQNYRTLKSASQSLAGMNSAGKSLAESSALLLRFYAVEVGLKFLLNQTLKIPFRHETTTKGVPNVEKFSHDLEKMVAELKVPAGRVPSPPAAPFKCLHGFNQANGGQEFNLDEAHQAWRYGLTVDRRIQLRSAPRLKEAPKTCSGVRKSKHFLGLRLSLSSII